RPAPIEVGPVPRGHAPPDRRVRHWSGRLLVGGASGRQEEDDEKRRENDKRNPSVASVQRGALVSRVLALGHGVLRKVVWPIFVRAFWPGAETSLRWRGW